MGGSHKRGINHPRQEQEQEHAEPTMRRLMPSAACKSPLAAHLPHAAKLVQAVPVQAGTEPEGPLAAAPAPSPAAPARRALERAPQRGGAPVAAAPGAASPAQRVTEAGRLGGAPAREILPRAGVQQVGRQLDEPGVQLLSPPAPGPAAVRGS